MVRLRVIALTPVSVRCSWKLRRSSAVAVSGERLSQAANRLQARIWPTCVPGTSWRAIISSIMR